MVYLGKFTDYHLIKSAQRLYSLVCSKSTSDIHYASNPFVSDFICSDMYLAAGEFMKAVEIMGENGWVEK